MRDLELREQVERALEYEPSIEAAEIGVAVENGIVTLTGHVATYPQKVTAERVVQALRGVRGLAQQMEVRHRADKMLSDDQLVERALSSLAWNVTVPSENIKVKVQRGWVTLTGKVEWEYQRIAAEDTIQKLSGVVGLTSEIIIEPMIKVSDIRDRIREALKRDAQVNVNDVSIEVDEGTVTLVGTVHTWAERQSAKRAAWSAPGVVRVDDRLTVG